MLGAQEFKQEAQLSPWSWAREPTIQNLG